MVFINPYSDKMGAGWNVIQSMIAVGSGGFSARDSWRDPGQLNFLPAHHTDFIFPWWGRAGLIGAFTLLVSITCCCAGREIIAAAKDEFGRLIAAE